MAKQDVDAALRQVLPAVVQSTDLVSDTLPSLHAPDIDIVLWGSFVGCCQGEPLTSETEPDTLRELLTGFTGQTLTEISSGRSWLHLDLSDGWFRVVADEPEPWVIHLPSIVWVGARAEPGERR